MEGDSSWKDVGMVREDVVNFRQSVWKEVRESEARGPAQSSGRTLGSHAK